jgi:hypothetical protein
MAMEYHLILKFTEEREHPIHVRKEERLFVERWYNSIGSESEMSPNVKIYLEKSSEEKILRQLDKINDHKKP